MNMSIRWFKKELIEFYGNSFYSLENFITCMEECIAYKNNKEDIKIRTKQTLAENIMLLLNQ